MYPVSCGGCVVLYDRLHLGKSSTDVLFFCTKEGSQHTRVLFDFKGCAPILLLPVCADRITTAYVYDYA